MLLKSVCLTVALESACCLGAAEIPAEFQTRRSLWFVEIKRKHEIGRDIETEVDRKVAAIRRPEGVSAKTALVYDGHL